MSMNEPAVSRIETEVKRIQALLQRGELVAALQAAESLRAEVPENRDVLYLIAVAQRYLRRVPEALATLAELERLHPAYSRLYQERGHCHVALREAQPAIEAFLRAVNLNPALPGSWNSLQTLFKMTGRTEDAVMAAGHVKKLAELPTEVVTATSMFSDGDIYLAEQVIRDFLQRHGHHVEAMRLLAKIGVRLDVLDDAEALLAGALELAPDYHAARHDYALVLLQRHKHLEAQEEFERLLRVDPNDRAFRIGYAGALVGLGQHERALEMYQRILEELPQAADVQLSVAHALKTIGRQQQAIDSYRAAIGLRPSYGEAYWSLANLKTYRFTAEEIARMRTEVEAAAVSQDDRYHLCFALGKALEDQGDYAGSFVHYERGNALKKAELRFKIEPIERNARLQRQVCTRELFESRRGVGFPSDAPIFIVGLPRAGSTLLEQILSSHSQVEGTMELAHIPRLVGELQGRDAGRGDPRYPAILTELTPQALYRHGEQF
ncbi:MAG TPA: tetratricopeptide repeat protein, partial [Steroidobacteraceae bacterium]|nr:tetratricopeptide repeat protein [Steroidobacteraceae bacterium]